MNHKTPKNLIKNKDKFSVTFNHQSSTPDPHLLPQESLISEPHNNSDKKSNNKEHMFNFSNKSQRSLIKTDDSKNEMKSLEKNIGHDNLPIPNSSSSFSDFSFRFNKSFLNSNDNNINIIVNNDNINNNDSGIAKNNNLRQNRDKIGDRIDKDEMRETEKNIEKSSSLTNKTMKTHNINSEIYKKENEYKKTDIKTTNSKKFNIENLKNSNRQSITPTTPNSQPSSPKRNHRNFLKIYKKDGTEENSVINSKKSVEKLRGLKDKTNKQIGEVDEGNKIEAAVMSPKSDSQELDLASSDEV